MIIIFIDDYYFLDNYFNQNDWRVRVNILNAVGNLPSSDPSFQKEKIADELLEIGSRDSSKNAAITSFAVLSKLFSGIELSQSLSLQIRQSLQRYLFPAETFDWHIRSAAVQAFAKIFKDSVVGVKRFVVFLQLQSGFACGDHKASASAEAAYLVAQFALHF